MPFTLILILLVLISESFATSWYSGAINAKLSEKMPYPLAVGLAVTKAIVLALAILVGKATTFSLPWYYLTMAYALMFIIGLKIITETLRFRPEERIVLIDSNKTIVLLSFAGSFNTFFIGLSLGLIGTGVLLPVLITFTGTLILSLLSMIAGKKYGLRPVIRYLGIIAGAVIAGISLRFFITYFIQ